MSNEVATQHYNEGLRQANKRNWHKALQFLRNAISEDSGHVNSYNALGMIHMRQGCITTARKYWTKALKIDPENATAKQCLLALDVRAPRPRLRKLLWSITFIILLVSLVASNLFWIYHSRGLPNMGGLAKAMLHRDQDAEVEHRGELELAEQEPQPVGLETHLVGITPPPRVPDIYDEARADCNAGKYSLAVSRFRQIIEHPSSHDLKDNAQYWLGECYYAQGEYEQALIEFQRVKENYPGTNKVFDSELKIAYTHCRLGHAEQARQKLLQLSRDFSDEKYQSSIAVLSEKIKLIETQEPEPEGKDKGIADRSGDSSDKG
jgi:TolA-binding protein